MIEEVNISDPISAPTSWGQPDREIDPRALRRYLRFLTSLSNIGEIMFWSFLVINATTCLAVVFLTVWEVPILSDGTDLVCVFDNTTQQVFRVE